MNLLTFSKVSHINAHARHQHRSHGAHLNDLLLINNKCVRKIYFFNLTKMAAARFNFTGLICPVLTAFANDK